MAKASRNHWEAPTNPYQHELRRLLEQRYALAVANVEGVVYEPGCGHGYGTFMLVGSAKVERVLSRDTDAAAVAIASVHLAGNAKVRLAVGDIMQLPVPQCNWIVCLETMMYLHDPEAFLHKLKDADPEGMVLEWPLGTENGPFGRSSFEAGQMAELMADWTGEVKPQRQRSTCGVVQREFELGVFRRPA